MNAIQDDPDRKRRFRERRRLWAYEIPAILGEVRKVYRGLGDCQSRKTWSRKVNQQMSATENPYRTKGSLAALAAKPQAGQDSAAPSNVQLPERWTFGEETPRRLAEAIAFTAPKDVLKISVDGPELNMTPRCGDSPPCRRASAA